MRIFHAALIAFLMGAAPASASLLDLLKDVGTDMLPNVGSAGTTQLVDNADCAEIFGLPKKEGCKE